MCVVITTDNCELTHAICTQCRLSLSGRAGMITKWQEVLTHINCGKNQGRGV